MVARGAFFAPGFGAYTADGVEMQYPAYYVPPGEPFPKWDPKQVSHHDWHQIVKAEMDNNLRNAGIIQDVYSKISVFGPKAREFLDRTVTCIVPKVVGNARLGYVCDRDGMLRNELTIATRAENDFYYCGQGGQGQYEHCLLARIRDEMGYSDSDVNIVNESHHYELIHVCGPKARKILTEVVGKEVTDVPLFKFRRLTVGGVDMEVFRMSFTGQKGWELHVPVEHVHAIYEELLNHPVSKAEGLKPYGVLAVNGLRIEQHYRVKSDVQAVSHYRNMSIGRFMSKKKAESSVFNGADNDYVPTNEFLFVEVDTPPGYEWTLTFSPKSPVFLNGEEIGRTTSAGWGPITKRTHAGVFLSALDLPHGQELSIQAHGQEFSARVLRTPPIEFMGPD